MALKLHNAMWPGLVGKGDGPDQEPPISLDRMLQLTADAEVNGRKFDGIDYFLFHPHTDPYASDDELRKIADKIQSYGFTVGSLVAPIWPGTVGDSAMGDDAAQAKFLEAIKVGCRIAKIFNEHGVRKYGVIRLDSAEFGIEKWKTNARANTLALSTPLKGCENRGRSRRAIGCGRRDLLGWNPLLERCARHLEGVAMPKTFGFQADLAHTYLYLLGYNAPEHALLKPGYSSEEFYSAYKQMTDKLRPWTIDFHVAQNDGQVHGAGSHDKTGKHCPADDPNGKLDIVRCSSYWLKDYDQRNIQHICWDGCMFPNSTLENPATWKTILAKMIEVAKAVDE